MLRHAVLVSCEPLFCYRLDFIYQIMLKAYGLVIPCFVVVIYPVACESDLGWDNRFISICQPKWCFSCRCPCCRSVCPQYAQQFLRPYALCPLEPSLDDLEQGSVCNIDLPVSLWVGEGGVVISDS